MSLRDGQVQNGMYLTSDIALTAYLITRGYELLGALDTGSPRKEFGLIPPITLEEDQLLKEIEQIADEYNNVFLEIPHNGARVNFRVFFNNIKNCHHALDEAIRKDRR